MAILVPAILENTKSEFMRTLGQIIKIPGLARVQVDFSDGIFVKNKILDILDVPVLPPGIHWEAHVMLKSPMHFSEYKDKGFSTIIVHYESYSSEEVLIEAFKNIVHEGLLPVLCINPETPVSLLKNFEVGIRQFQLMSIHPGFQGTEFLETTFQRVAELRKMCPNAILEIDGGVNEKNIKKLSDLGIQYIVVGSAITKKTSFKEAYDELKQLL